MKKICFKVDSPYQNNQLFQERGDLNFVYRVKKILENKNHIVGTQDIIDEDEADIIIYLDYRKDFRSNEKKKVLLAMESIAVIPKTFEKKYTDKFDLTFTFLDDIVDNNRIFKINYSFDLEKEVGISFKDKTKFLCNFSSNKFSSHKNELYTKRIEAIEYYENIEDNIFDLYGFGWDKSYSFPVIYDLVKGLQKYKLSRALVKTINSIPVKMNPFLKTYKCYQGSVNDKYEYLKKYKFSICYENVSGVNGYITEKIFDCFKNEVVPIYLGPDNIEDIIPKESFINRNNFSSEEEVFNYLNKIDESKYTELTNAGKSFLNSDKAKFFDSYETAKYISNKIITCLNND